MPPMVDPARIKRLNDDPPHAGGRYVLYWMQQSQRTRHNPALEVAAERANAAGLPLVVCFGVMDDYPEANARHYLFLLQGLRDVQVGLAERGVKFVVRRGTAYDAAALRPAPGLEHWGHRERQPLRQYHDNNR